MAKFPTVPLQMLPDLLWLQFTLMHRLDAAGVEEWLRRCRLHLKSLGLQSVVSTSRIVAIGDGRQMTAAKRGEAILWLVAQPEVSDVRVGVGAIACSCGDAGEVLRA